MAPPPDPPPEPPPIPPEEEPPLPPPEPLQVAQIALARIGTASNDQSNNSYLWSGIGDLRIFPNTPYIATRPFSCRNQDDFHVFPSGTSVTSVSPLNALRLRIDSVLYDANITLTPNANAIVWDFRNTTPSSSALQNINFPYVDLGAIKFSVSSSASLTTTTFTHPSLQNALQVGQSTYMSQPMVLFCNDQIHVFPAQALVTLTRINPGGATRSIALDVTWAGQLFQCFLMFVSSGQAAGFYRFFLSTNVGSISTLIYSS